VRVQWLQVPTLASNHSDQLYNKGIVKTKSQLIQPIASTLTFSTNNQQLIIFQLHIILHLLSPLVIQVTILLVSIKLSSPPSPLGYPPGTKGCDFPLRLKKPNFFALSVLAKALLPAKLLFRECPPPPPPPGALRGGGILITLGAGGCQAVIGWATEPALFGGARIGT